MLLVIPRQLLSVHLVYPDPYITESAFGSILPQSNYMHVYISLLSSILSKGKWACLRAHQQPYEQPQRNIFQQTLLFASGRSLQTTSGLPLQPAAIDFSNS